MNPFVFFKSPWQLKSHGRRLPVFLVAEKTCWLVLVFAAVSIFPQTARAMAGQPVAQKTNVVLILVDDLGWKDLACYGSDFYQTPHIDRLAKEGM